MKRHEWKGEDATGVCHFRATHHAGRWEMHVLREGLEDWEREDPIPVEHLRELRDVLFRKYQRRRVPFEHVAQLDELIQAAQ